MQQIKKKLLKEKGTLLAYFSRYQIQCLLE